MKKVLIIALGTVVLAALALSYLLFLTDVFDAPLTSEQIEQKVNYIYTDHKKRLADIAGESEKAVGDSECFYAVIDTYSQYKRLLINLDPTEFSTDILNLDRSYFNKYSLVLIEDDGFSVGVREVCTAENKLSVFLISKGFLGGEKRIIAMTVSKKTLRNIDEIEVNTRQTTTAYKPVIYLYPETEAQATVKLGYKENITVSYPEYVDGWNVLAKPDGKLVYNETGRNLYSLYYECENAVDFKIEKDGFVVKKEDVAEFLEEKLAILGLNEYEAEEFIIYWLPILQANEYNYIRFATADEIERNMPLEIDPNPDTVIRVLMTFKGLDAPTNVVEQKLETPERTGFVAVEWGGTLCI